MSILNKLKKEFYLPEQSKNMAKEFEVDPKLFRSVLKEIFLLKIQSSFGSWIRPETDINDAFHRPNRRIEIDRFEESFEIRFPKMILAPIRLRLLIISMVPIQVSVFIYILYTYNPVFYPEGLLIFLFILVLVPIPPLIVDYFSPNYFTPDWPRVNTVEDILSDLVNINFIDFTLHEYRRTIDELNNIFANTS